MKTLVLIATLFTSFTVIAGLGPNSTWIEILSNDKLVIDGPKVGFNNTYVSIVDTCYVESTDQMRTAKKVMTYTRTSRGDRDIWTPAGKKYLFTDRVYEREICGGHGDRCDWQVITEEYDLNPMIDLRAQPRGDRSFGPVLFSKVFNVPAC